MSSAKVPTRNVVPAKRPATQSADATTARTRPGPTQPFTDAQRNGLLKDMREPSGALPAAAIADEELEVEIQVGGEEAAAPAQKRASTNAHVARRTK